MTNERIVRSFAGTVVLASLALGVWVNPNWLWLTAFAGLNLLQSGFTSFCLPEIVLRKARAS
jgi:Inner membrane protein YgaP-like, transmembrane domain